MQRNGRFEQRDYRQLYTPAGNKFVIGTLHGDPIEIVAQYNPKELSRSASASWTPHPNTSAKQSKTSGNHLWMEYGTTEPRSLTFELLFDGYEEGISIAGIIEQLEALTLPKNMSSLVESERHPQLCVAVWGKQSLRCVVMSIATKFSMFDASGEPLRATCSVTLKEVDVVAMMHKSSAAEFQQRQDNYTTRSGGETTKMRRHWSDSRPVVDATLRSQLRGTNAAPVAAPAPAAAKPVATKPTPSAPPVTPVSIPGVADEDEQDQQDDQAIAAQNSQDRKADDAADAAPPKTEAVTGTSHMPGGTYEVGAPSEQVDPNTIEASDPPAPKTEAVAGTDQMPGGTYGVGSKSTPFAGDDDLDSPRQSSAFDDLE